MDKILNKSVTIQTRKAIERYVPVMFGVFTFFPKEKFRKCVKFVCTLVRVNRRIISPFAAEQDTAFLTPRIIYLKPSRLDAILTAGDNYNIQTRWYNISR